MVCRIGCMEHLLEGRMADIFISSLYLSCWWVIGKSLVTVHISSLLRTKFTEILLQGATLMFFKYITRQFCSDIFIRLMQQAFVLLLELLSSFWMLRLCLLCWLWSLKHHTFLLSAASSWLWSWQILTRRALTMCRAYQSKMHKYFVFPVYNRKGLFIENRFADAAAIWK